MADRSAAAAFGAAFKLILKHVPHRTTRETLARALAEECAAFDFTPEQMNASDELRALGLGDLLEDDYGDH